MFCLVKPDGWKFRKHLICINNVLDYGVTVAQENLGLLVSVRIRLVQLWAKEESIILQNVFGGKCKRKQDLGMQGKHGGKQPRMLLEKIIRSSSGFSGVRNGLQMSYCRECQWGFQCLMRYGDGIKTMEISASGRACDSGSQGYRFKSYISNVIFNIF